MPLVLNSFFEFFLFLVQLVLVSFRILSQGGGEECLVDLGNPGTGRSIQVKPNQIILELDSRTFTQCVRGK